MPNLRKRWIRGSALALIALLAVAPRADEALAQGFAPQDFSKITPLPEKVTLRMAAGNTQLNSAFVLYGIAKGYFQRVNLDVQVQPVSGSAVSTAPLLARGDLDLAPQAPSQALFNMISQGFGVKAIMPEGGTKEGRPQPGWLMLPPDKEDTIKTIADLKGKTIDASQVGSGIDFLVHEILEKAHLDPEKDVKLLYRNRSSADFLTLAKSHSQDAIGMNEPSASQVERLGYDKRWVSMADVAPWFQDLVLVASEKALQEKPEAIRKFAEVFILIGREIDSSNGEWTDDLMQIATKISGQTPQDVRFMGGAPWIDPNGTLSMDALNRNQNMWFDAKQLKQKIDLNQLVDLRPVQDALKVVGRVDVPQ